MFLALFYLLYSIYFFIVLVVSYILFSVPILMAYPFLGKKRHYYYAVVAKYWGITILWLVGLLPKTYGKLPPEKRPYIYLFNHQSQLDILIALAFLPPGFLFVAKEELFKVPFLGFAMRRCGYIPIKRTDTRRANETLTTLHALIAAGTSILIFPEGTRSKTGKIGEIKKGSLRLAFDTATPLIPVVINPAYQIMPKGSFLLRPKHMKLQIGEVIRFEWDKKDRDYMNECAKKIETTLISQLQQIS